MQRYKKNQRSTFLTRISCALCLCVLSLTTPLVAVAQPPKVTLTRSVMPVDQVLKEIEAQSNYLFVVMGSSLNLTRVVTLPDTVATINHLLDLILAETNCQYRYVDRNIIITKKARTAATEAAQQQPVINYTIEGLVVDDRTGQPVKGAQVFINGMPDKRTRTSATGAFALSNIPLGYGHIKVAAEGYYPTERGVNFVADKLVQIEVRLTPTSSPAAIPAPAPAALPTPSATPAKASATAATTSPAPAATVSPAPDTTLAVVEATVIEANQQNQETTPPPTYVQTHQVAQRATIAQKTNLLYWATTSPNFGIEVAVAPQWTVDVSVGYNPWNFSNNASLRHWLVNAEGRYWTCNTFEGHFFGLHGIYGRYTMGNLGFVSGDLHDYTFRGNAYGMGLSYGYHFPLWVRWGLELTAGLGYMHFSYDKYLCAECAEYVGSYRRNYVGPTKLGVTLIYMLK